MAFNSYKFKRFLVFDFFFTFFIEVLDNSGAVSVISPDSLLFLLRAPGELY